MKKCKKDSNLDEAFEEMRKKAEEGISLAEQIVDLKSYHEHNLKLMKGLNDKINKLEKENQDLRDNYDQFKASAIPEIERLQKENAKLKIARDNCEEQFQDKVDELAIEVDRVIRAKEIIKELIEAIHIWDCENLEQVEAKAEQFLNSDVEK